MRLLPEAPPNADNMIYDIYDSCVAFFTYDTASSTVRLRALCTVYCVHCALCTQVASSSTVALLYSIIALVLVALLYCSAMTRYGSYGTGYSTTESCTVALL
jgi:hypothetical protein